MSIEPIIKEVRTNLEETFAAIDRWFEEPQPVLDFRPAPGKWTAGEVLEHIGLTNHFLLILIEKGAQKALVRAETENPANALRDYEFHRDKLTEIGLHRSFTWIRPEHMEPRGEKSPAEVRSWLGEQLTQCLDVLNRLKNGEGALCKTTMTVNDLGKIDVYEYLYFLAQHGRRHITQMENNKIAYLER